MVFLTKHISNIIIFLNQEILIIWSFYYVSVKIIYNIKFIYQKYNNY
jgi:hypothetical protein